VVVEGLGGVEEGDGDDVDGAGELVEGGGVAVEGSGIADGLLMEPGLVSPGEVPVPLPIVP
jgi:hypothetical protein